MRTSSWILVDVSVLHLGGLLDFGATSALTQWFGFVSRRAQVVAPACVYSTPVYVAPAPTRYDYIAPAPTLYYYISAPQPVYAPPRVVVPQRAQAPPVSDYVAEIPFIWDEYRD